MTINPERDALAELLDARDRCRFNGRGWHLCNNAVTHLVERWLFDITGQHIHLLGIDPLRDVLVVESAQPLPPSLWRN